MRILIFILMLFAFPLAVSAAENSVPSGDMPGMSMPENGDPAADAGQPAPKETLYICPMHPHIHGEKGDRCPICGMDLVPANEPKSSTKPVEEGKRKILYWYDPMVPGQKFDKPGKSPYMDMDLVPFYENEASSGQKAPENAVHIDPVNRQSLGVKTALVKMQEFGKAIHAFGNIAPSTRHEYTVAVRTAGWIVDLQTDAVGDTVKKGDLLFTFYSPDLMTAQSDYLIGSRVGNAQQRLRLYGMDEKSIAVLKEKGKFLEATPFYAPADGTISMLNVRRGAYMEEGGMVLALQDYSQVWVQAHLPLRDMQFLTIGTPATVAIDETGESFRAAVDFIYPATDLQSRNGLARLVLDNPDGKLKTDALVDVAFEVDGQQRLAVPAEAVLYSKEGGHVITALGDGYFRPVKVKTGITSHGMTEIVSGLEEGEEIVTSGQFMIDAESSLSGGMATMSDRDMPDAGQTENSQNMEMGNGHKH